MGESPTRRLLLQPEEIFDLPQWANNGRRGIKQRTAVTWLAPDLRGGLLDLPLNTQIGPAYFLGLS